MFVSQNMACRLQLNAQTLLLSLSAFHVLPYEFTSIFTCSSVLLKLQYDSHILVCGAHRTREGFCFFGIVRIAPTSRRNGAPTPERPYSSCMRRTTRRSSVDGDQSSLTAVRAAQSSTESMQSRPIILVCAQRLVFQIRCRCLSSRLSMSHSVFQCPPPRCDQ